MQPDISDGKGKIKVKWQIKAKSIPEGSRQLFLPLYLQDPSTIKLRTAGVQMSGISDVANGFLLHRVAGYHVALFTQQGRADFTARGETRRLEPGSLLFAPAGAEHRYGPVPGTGGWRFFWFHLLPVDTWDFEGSDEPVLGRARQPDRLFEAMRGFVAEILPRHTMMHSDNEAPFFYVDAPLLDDSVSQFDLFGSDDSAAAHDNNMAPAYAELILEYLRREMRALFHQPIEVESRYPLRDVWREIGNNPSGDWSLPSLAGRMNMSVSTLLRLIRRRYDATPAVVILHIRLRIAARMLAESDHSIQEIARHAGYGSMSSFAAAFKKHFKRSPRQYRQMAENEQNSLGPYPRGAFPRAAE